MNPGRLAAGRALLSIDEGAHAEAILAEVAPPSGVDRGLAWHLVLGVIRRRGSLDEALRPLLNRGTVGDLDPEVRAALRIGAFELLLSRTPRHAAVSQAVELVRCLGGARASGLINAVLRRLPEAALSDDPTLDLPPWLVGRWRDSTDWLKRLQEPAPLCGVWRDDPVVELDAQAAYAAGDLVPGCFSLPDASGVVTDLPGFAEGRWWVMDPSAAAVADLARDAALECALGRAGDPTPTVLDACAAPGGKTLRLAARGARVTATDESPARLGRIRENLSRTGLSAQQILAWDWLEGPCPELGRFDAVLVDAPCTGLGVLRRHPEIKWRRLPSDPAAMALRQLPILENAAQHVAPGGALIYSVCSPMPEEGEAVLARLSGWQVSRSWAATPPLGDEDAFQAFVLRRSSDTA